MKCDELSNDVLMDLAERRMEAGRADEVTRHLLECEGCGEKYLEVTRIRETTRLAIQAVPNEGLDQRVISTTQKVLAVKRKRSLKRILTAALLSLLGAGAVAAAVYFFFLR